MNQLHLPRGTTAKYDADGRGPRQNHTYNRGGGRGVIVFTRPQPLVRSLSRLRENIVSKAVGNKEPQFSLKSIQQGSDLGDVAALLRAQEHAQCADANETQFVCHGPPFRFVDENRIGANFQGQRQRFAFTRVQGSIGQISHPLAILWRLNANERKLQRIDGDESLGWMLELSGDHRGNQHLAKQQM